MNKPDFETIFWKILIKVTIKLFTLLLHLFSFLFSFFGLWIIPIILSSYLVVSGFGAVKEAASAAVEKVKGLVTSTGQVLNKEVAIDILEQVNGYSPFDLSPFPNEQTVCDSGCNCSKTDSYLEVTEEADGTLTFNQLQETKRLNTGEGDYRNRDWTYTGWTYYDQSFYDIDYSKFTNKADVIEDLNKEYLFKWHINQMNSSGKQLMTTEFRSEVDIDFIKQKFDESTRVGSFITAYNKMTSPDRRSREDPNPPQYLDLGNVMVKSYDCRIYSAFTPMITSGENGFKALLEARKWFHRGDVWQGVNALDNDFFLGGGLNLWGQDVGVGTYIDVVVEDPKTRTQWIIPFVYGDAKNIHWFKGAGQQVDQRYGQTQVTRQYSGSNGKYKNYLNLYTARFEKVDNVAIDASTTGISFLKSCVHEKFVNKISDNAISQGVIIEGLKVKPYDLDYYVFVKNGSSSTPEYYKLTDFKEQTYEIEETYLSDDDVIKHRSSSALELLHYYYDYKLSKTGQDFNKLMMNAIFKGVFVEDKVNNNWPELELVGMRVYPEAHKDSKSFTERSQEFNEVDSIPVGNQIIKFCGEQCKCKICTKIAR